jgi:hypothetical protein
VQRIAWPWKVEAILGLEVKGSRRVRIELQDVFCSIVDTVMRLPASERGRVVVWVSLERVATELRFADIQQWGERPDRPLPRVRPRQIAGIMLETIGGT